MKSKRVLIAKKKCIANNSLSSIGNSNKNNNSSSSFLSERISYFIDEKKNWGNDNEDVPFKVPVKIERNLKKEKMNNKKREFMTMVEGRVYGMKEVVDDLDNFDIDSLGKLDNVIDELNGKLKTYQDIYFNNEEIVKKNINNEKEGNLYEDEEEGDREENSNEKDFNDKEDRTSVIIAEHYRKGKLYDKIYEAIHLWIKCFLFRKNKFIRDKRCYQLKAFYLININAKVNAFIKRRNNYIRKNTIDRLKYNVLYHKILRQRFLMIRRVYIEKIIKKEFNHVLKFQYLAKLCYASHLSLYTKREKRFKSIIIKHFIKYYFNLWNIAIFSLKTRRLYFHLFLLYIIKKTNHQKSNCIINNKTTYIHSLIQTNCKIKFLIRLREQEIHNSKQMILNAIAKKYILTSSSFAKNIHLIIKKRKLHFKFKKNTLKESLRFLIQSTALLQYISKVRKIKHIKEEIDNNIKLAMIEIKQLNQKNKEIIKECKEIKSIIPNEESEIENIQNENLLLKQELQTAKIEYQKEFAKNLNKINELSNELENKNKKKNSTDKIKYIFSSNLDDILLSKDKKIEQERRLIQSSILSYNNISNEDSDKISYKKLSNLNKK